MPTITTEDEAVAAARQLVTTQPLAADPVVDEHAEDHGWCWTVGWRTRASAASGTPMAPGSGPVLVLRESGEAHYLGSAPLATQLADIKEALGIA